MNKFISKLPLLTTVVFCVWISIQIGILCTYWDMPNHDDAASYQELAQECVDKGTWYPGAHSVNEPFIFGPAYINLLVLLHHLFGSFYVVRLLNLILNILMLFEVFLFTKHLFDKNTAYIAALLYMFTFSNLYLSIAMLTDLPFTFLLLTALLLCLKKKLFYLILAGILMALANWFRPLALIFLLTVMVWFVVERRKWIQYAALMLPLLMTVFVIGQSTKARTGYFVYQAVSGGYNLAMSSFDKANGLVNFSGFGDPDNSIYLTRPITFDYMERDSFLKKAAVRWIIENPGKYLAQLPLKFGALYCEDTWTERVKPDRGFRTILAEAKNKQLVLAEIGVELFMKSLVYYGILFFFGYYLWAERRMLLRQQNIFLLIPLLGTAITLVFVITSRYHYPYLFVITIYAAAGLWHCLNKHFLKRVGRLI